MSGLPWSSAGAAAMIGQASTRYPLADSAEARREAVEAERERVWDLIDAGTCPKCLDGPIWRDSADVGVGVMYGPWGCPCGWSENDAYDVTEGPKYTEAGYRLDQWGLATPPVDEAQS